MATRAPLGVIAALPAEARTFGARLPCNSIASLGGNSLLFVCGVGAENATRAVKALAAAGVAGVVSWGTAGGLDPRLKPGDCVIPHTVKTDDQSYPADAGWAQRIADRLDSTVPLFRGPLYTTSRVARPVGAKREWFAQTGALAVDTESAGVAHAAQSLDLPWIAIRVVMDDADTALPDYTWRSLDEQGFNNLGRIVWHLVRHPADLGTVPRLLHDYRRARQTLSHVFRDAGPRLLARD